MGSNKAIKEKCLKPDKCPFYSDAMDIQPDGTQRLKLYCNTSMNCPREKKKTLSSKQIREQNK